MNKAMGQSVSVKATTNTDQQQLEEHNKGSVVLTGPANFPDPNLIQHL